MKEVLSQDEIDSLLAALSTGEVKAEDLKGNESEQASAKLYDFRRPNKFSKDQLRTLFMIHDNFARILSNFLSVYLRANIQIRVATVDQITYEDFTKSIPSPTLLVVYHMEPLNGTAILETNPMFAFPVVDLLFGGEGSSPNKIREMTDIEIGVLKKLYTKILDNLSLAWQEIIDITPQIESLETNPRFNQVISPNETVAIITFITTVGETQGLMNLCIPFISLESIISKLSAHYWFASNVVSSEDEQQKRIKKILSDVPTEVYAYLGASNVSVREFLQLKSGDILQLDTGVKDKIPIYAEQKLIAKAQPGKFLGKTAVQVTDLIREGEDNLE